VGTLSAVGKSLGGIAASLVAVAKGDFREAGGILSATFDGVVDSVKDDAETITGLWSDAGKEVKKTGEKIQDTSNKTKKVLEQEGQAAAAVGKAHLDRSKALKDSLEEANKALEDDLKSTKNFNKEIKDLVREMQAATGKDGQELGVLDFAESLNNAQQALRAGDFDGAIEGARDTADLLREMKKAGVESDLVLTGLAQQLERFAATASTGQIEAAQQAAEQAQKNLEQAAEKKPVTTPLVLDTTQAEAQLDALVQQASAPIVKKIHISDGGASFSDRPISADEAIRQEARKKGSR
jgi:hypothetical protein